MVRTTIILAFMLAGCGQRTITLAEGQCRTLQIGDRVEGVATLDAYNGGICLECGAKLKQTGCDGEIGYRNANDAVDDDYHRIIRELPANRDYQSDGFVSGRVFVAGEVIPNGADGSPMLNAEVIRLEDE
jgi:hypothetical protein